MVIPDAVDQLIQTNTLTCTVIDSSDPWQWVTNSEDRPRVSKAFDTMHEKWIYPKDLWILM
jgi:hypothetical protein